MTMILMMMIVTMVMMMMIVWIMLPGVRANDAGQWC